MAIDWEPIKAALHAWMTAGASLPPGRVIWANQGAPIPPIPYASINYRLAVARLGISDEERATTTDGVIAHVGQRRVSVSCNLYGKGAIALLEAAQEALQTYAGRAPFDAANLAVLDKGEVRDLSALEDTQIEERAQLDLVIGLATVTNEVVGWIEDVAISVGILTDGTPVPPLSVDVDAVTITDASRYDPPRAATGLVVTILASDTLVLLRPAAAGNLTVQLPPNPDARTYRIKLDEGDPFAPAARQVTVLDPAGPLIDGAATFPINVNRGLAGFVKVAGAWSVAT